MDKSNHRYPGDVGGSGQKRQNNGCGSMIKAPPFLKSTLKLYSQKVGLQLQCRDLPRFIFTPRCWCIHCLGFHLWHITQKKISCSPCPEGITAIV